MCLNSSEMVSVVVVKWLSHLPVALGVFNSITERGTQNVQVILGGMDALAGVMKELHQ